MSDIKLIRTGTIINFWFNQHKRQKSVVSVFCGQLVEILYSATTSSYGFPFLTSVHLLR